MLSHPPFARVVLVGSSRHPPDAAADVGTWREVNRLRATADGPVIQVFGPTLAPLSRLVGRWRFQVILRGRDVPRFRAAKIDEVTPILLESDPRKGSNEY